MKNIYALTHATAGGYPPYISVNRTDRGVEITVRSQAKADNSCGDCGVITLSMEQFAALCRDGMDEVWHTT